MPWSTTDEFKVHGLPPSAVWSGAWADVVDHLDGAQSDINDAFREAGDELPIPVTSISLGIKRRECIIGGYRYLMVRGWEASSPADSEYVKEYERCLKWLEAVANGAAKPLPIDPVTEETQDADPTTEPAGAEIDSDTRRNWSALCP